MTFTPSEIIELWINIPQYTITSQITSQIPYAFHVSQMHIDQLFMSKWVSHESPYSPLMLNKEWSTLLIFFLYYTKYNTFYKCSYTVLYLLLITVVYDSVFNIIRVPIKFQVMLKRLFSRLYCENFFHQKVDNKDVLKLQEYKTWEKLPEYNIQMLYIS